MTNLAFVLEKNTFVDLFESISLPVPHLPKELASSLDSLEEYYPNVFSTEARSLPTSFSTLDLYNLDCLFPKCNTNDKINYFSCGLHNKSKESWQFTYLLDCDKIQLAIALPWAKTFTNLEYNRSKLEMAYLLIETCSIYSNPRFKIRAVLNARQCVWELIDTEGNTISEGSNIQILINTLLHFNI